MDAIFAGVKFIPVHLLSRIFIGFAKPEVILKKLRNVGSQVKRSEKFTKSEY